MSANAANTSDAWSMRKGKSRFWLTSLSHFRDSIRVLAICECVFLVLAFFINLWFLASILSSKKLRARVRNQMIAGLSFLNVLMAAILSSIQTFNAFRLLNQWKLSEHYRCHAVAYTKTMALMESIFEDYMILTLIVVFLAQVLNFRPASRLKPSHLKIGHAALLLGPWVLGLVAAPPSLALMSFRGYPCVNARRPQLLVLDVIYTLVPIAASIMMVAAAVVIRYSRARQGDASGHRSLGAQLMGSGPEEDSPIPYALAVGLCLLCEITDISFRVKRVGTGVKTP